MLPNVIDTSFQFDEELFISILCIGSSSAHLIGLLIRTSCIKSSLNCFMHPQFTNVIH